MLDFVVVAVTLFPWAGAPDIGAGRHLGAAPVSDLVAERRVHRDVGACEQAIAGLSPPPGLRLVCVLGGAEHEPTAPTVR